jgi:oligopeptide transport system substrate-binding protein
MVIRATADVNTTYNEYLNGKVDWIRSVGAAKVEEAQANPDYYVAPYLGTYFFRFNVTKKPFDDVRVRKALNYAVDKKAICETVLKAGQVPATGVVPPGIAGFPEFKGLPYDPKKARELLAEAGFPEGKGFPEFELLYNTRDDHKQVCEQMVEMWKTTLGVKARLENREWQIYLKDTHSMNYTVVRSAWIADYADPSTFLEMWRKDRGNNNTGWSNPRYEELMEKSIAESDPVKRFVHLADAEKILCAEDLPILPLYYYVNQGMLRPRVRGWHDNVRDMHPFQYIYIDGPAAGK